MSNPGESGPANIAAAGGTTEIDHASAHGPNPPHADPDPAMSDGAFVTARIGCHSCGYSLIGAPVASRCPECGSPVTDSMRGILLQFAGQGYLRQLLTGHSWVLNGILVQILAWAARVIVGAVAGVSGSGAASLVATAISAVGTLITIWIFLGYLKMTEVDPQFTGEDRPDRDRRITRIASICSIVFGGIVIIISLGVQVSPTALGDAGTIIADVATLGGFLALAVQFFGMMGYQQWLGRRIPDQWISRRAKTYRWLLPLLATVGALVLIGPLIALVMYWNLLDRMRKHLKSIVKTGAPATLPKMTA